MNYPNRGITENEIKSRLRFRAHRSGGHWQLDLRGEKWGGLGRIAVRRPGAPGWPDEGPTTEDRNTAEGWACHQDYLDLVNRRRHLDRSGPGVMTLREALDAYLEDLAQRLERDHPTLRNRSTSLVAHTRPLHGSILADLHRDKVQDLLDNMTVTRTLDGKRQRVPAAPNTRAAILRGLRAVWRHHMGRKAPPFDGVSPREDDERQSLRKKIIDGHDLRSELSRGAYEPDEVKRLVVAARHYDQQIIAPSPPLRGKVRQYSPEALSLLIGTGARIVEVRLMRWMHILDDNLLLVPGTKTRAALRVQPIQEALKPWLEHIWRESTRTYGREPTRHDYILQTSPRGYQANPAGRGLGEKVSKIQRAAGLKREGKASHIFRSTFISMARQQGFDLERLKHYVGHTNEQKRTVTDQYIHYVRSLIKPEDHQIIRCLPSPSEVQDLVQEFEPTIALTPGAGGRK